MLNPRRVNCRASVLKWAEEIMGWNIAWKSGIYPGEMAAFLGVCEFCHIESIVESGRGEDAYSTQILGEYSQRTGAKIFSIDLNPILGKNFQTRVQKYQELRCVVGDAFDVLPATLRCAPAPIALLLDGPKMGPANRLSLVATALFNVQVVAHHNCPLSSPWGTEFGSVFPEAFHYEELGLSQDSRWNAFKRWESEQVQGYELFDETHGIPGRALSQSSLAVAVIPNGVRSKWRLLRLPSGDFRYSPLFLWARWSLRRARASDEPR